MTKEFMGKVWRPRIEIIKAWDICKCVKVNSKRMEIFIIAP